MNSAYPNNQNHRGCSLLIRRTFFAVLFWLLLDCTSCLDAAAQATEKCPVLTATLDNCDNTFLFVWHGNGTIWNGGYNIKTFSGCYDKNECYIVEAGYANQGCKLQVVMDGIDVLRQTLSSDSAWFRKKSFFVGKCDVQCPKETTLLLTNSSPAAPTDIEFSFNELGKGYTEGVIRDGKMVKFCINLETCNVLNKKGYANDYLLEENNLIEEERNSNELRNMWGGSIVVGNCMKSCTDLKIILSIPSDQSYSYALKEDGYLIEEGNLVAGDDKEFCLKSSKCYQLDGNGDATYISIKDGIVISYEQNVDHRLIGSCKNICDDKPLLSSTKRSVEIFSVISSISTSEDLINIENERYKAICWLIYDDIKQLKATDPFLIQRYVLALFYLSTNGNNWHSTFGFMTASNECDWGGIICVDGYVTELNYSK